MSTEAWERLESVFHGARQLSGEERTRFLEEACGGDEVLRQEVHSLLDALREATTFLENDDAGESGSPKSPPDDRNQPIRSPAAAAVVVAIDDALPALYPGLQLHESAIPGYRILKRIHAGGQGVVYQAVRLATKRTVAIKVMREGPFAGRHDKARFEREIEVLAQLNHPHIVAIHDRGLASGHFYFVMDYVSGRPLDTWVDSNNLSVDEQLRLLLTVCEAVNAAHLRGITHRDLKPANIFIDDDGQPRILDFGLAKVATPGVTDGSQPSAMTATGQFMGSLQWASPEQAEGVSANIDVRSDVYSLGVILYRLLTGRFPYDVTGNLRDVLDNILRVEPLRPRTVCRRINDEVETIVLKCLAKERERRYQNAGELARDIRHCLAGEPIEAKRDSVLYVLRKRLRRYRTAAAVGAAFALLLLASSVVAWTLYARAEQARAQAYRQYVEVTLDRALQLCEQGQVDGGILWLGRTLELLPPDAGDLENVARANLAAWSRELPAWTAWLSHEGRVTAVAYSPDGRWIITGGEDGKARLWDAATGEPSGKTLESAGPLSAVAYSPDGRLIALGGRSGSPNAPAAQVALWDAQTLEQTGTLEHAEGSVSALAFSSDGRMLASATGGWSREPAYCVRVWDLSSHQAIRTLTDDRRPVWSVAFSPDGQKVYAGSGHPMDFDGRVRCWEIATGQSIGEPVLHRGVVSSVAVAPDGRTLATACGDGRARLWNLAEGASLRRELRHYNWVRSVCFSVDGSRLLTAGEDKIVQFWDVASGEPVGAPASCVFGVSSAALSPDGSRCVLAGEGRAALVLRMPVGNQLRSLAGHQGRVTSVRFLPDGSRVLSGSWDGTLRAWDAATGRLLAPSPRTETGESVDGIAVSLDGARVLLTGAPTHVLDASTLLPVLRLPTGGVRGAFSPDGSRIVTGGGDGVARVWDAATGGLQLEVKGHSGRWIYGLAFAPDGKSIITGAWDHEARRWDAATGEQIGKPAQHADTVNSIAFSPDGRCFGTGGKDHVARLWDAASHEPIASPMGHQGAVSEVAFSPDGSCVLTTSWDFTARVWDRATGKPIGPPLRHPASATSGAFSPDGTNVVTGSTDGLVRIWRAPPAPLEGEARQIALWTQVITGRELDAAGAVRPLNSEGWLHRRRGSRIQSGTALR